MTQAEHVTTTRSGDSGHVLTEFGDRLLWIRVFELGHLSLTELADLLGEGYNDSTIATWESNKHRPRDKAAVARRYREVARAFDKDISMEWILYGGAILVSLVTKGAALTPVFEPQLLLPIDLPPSRLEGEISAMSVAS